MRIALDLRRIHKTGIGRYARNLFAAMTRVAPEHAYTAIVQDQADAALVLSLAPTADCHIEPAAQYSAAEIFRAPRLQRGVDVLHSPHPYALGVGRRSGGRPRHVLTLLDLIQLTHPHGWRGRLAREPLRAIIRASCRRADGFVAISATTRDAFARRMGVPLDKIRVTPLAPDPVFAMPVSAAAVNAARERWSLSDSVVLGVGTGHPHKNLDRLLAAVARVIRSGRPTQLALVGPIGTSAREQLAAKARALGIEPHVRMLGSLAEAQLIEAYHVASVLALPSLAEGFGLTLLEAMRCGTPCLASDLPVLREVAGDAAEFVNPLEIGSIERGLRAVLSDDARSNELRELGYSNVARFSWEATARETLAAYQAALRVE